MKLYVGNLKYEVSSHQLADLFSQFGDVEDVRIITDRDTGRSKGFGFVVMKDQEGYDKALEHFNPKDGSGVVFEGRRLTVNPAIPQNKDGMGGKPRGGGRPSYRDGDYSSQY